MSNQTFSSGDSKEQQRQSANTKPEGQAGQANGLEDKKLNGPNRPSV